MLKKKRFKPVITQVKLNPEQAVLTCYCYNTGYMGGPSGPTGYQKQCNIGDPNNKTNDTNTKNWVTGGTFS